MYYLLKRLGKKVFIYNHDTVPGNLCFLPGSEFISTEEPVQSDYIGIVLDSADMFRIGKVEEAFKRLKIVINIDHHISNPEFGQLNYVDANASSASELVYLLYRLIFDDIEYEAAVAVYTGIYTDTGSFKYSCTSPASTSNCFSAFSFRSEA